MRVTILIFICFFNSFIAFPFSVKTICNGFSNDSTVWDGKVLNKKNDTIFVNHFIQLTSSFNLDSNILIVSKYGEICFHDRLTISGGSQIINYGSISARSIVVTGANSYSSILNYGFVHSQESIDIQTLGYLYTSGSVEIGSTPVCYNKNICVPIIFIQSTDSLISNIEGSEYQWMRNDTSIELNSRQIQASNSGYYKVKVKKQPLDDYTEYSDSIYFTFTPPVDPNNNGITNSTITQNHVSTIVSGVTQNNNNTVIDITVSIYPNPFNYESTFEFPSNDNYTLIIIDIHGRQVRHFQNISNGKLTVMRDNMESGLYFYTLSSQSTNNVIRGKFILNE